MKGYSIIKKYYGEKTTERTGVKLLNHIDEGLKILTRLGASDKVKEAYCLHPILQSDACFVANKGFDFSGVNYEVIILVMEYRRVANSYLSKNDISDFIGFSCSEVKEMLTADKVQNYKDFMKYHYETHSRSEDIYIYFHNWFELLAVDWSEWVDFNY